MQLDFMISPFRKRLHFGGEIPHIYSYSRSSHVHVTLLSPTKNARFKVGPIFKLGQSSLPLAGPNGYSEFGLYVIFLCLVEQTGSQETHRLLTAIYFPLCRFRSRESQPENMKNSEADINNGAKNERHGKKIESHQVCGSIFCFITEYFPTE